MFLALAVSGVVEFMALPARAEGGQVVAWGVNNYGETTVPANASNVIAVAAGAAHSLALVEDGTLLAWGGGGTVPPAGVSNLVNIVSSGFHSMGLYPDGSLWVWSPQADVATVPATATNIVRMAAGDGHVMALRADGQVLAWGDDYWGQTDVPADVTNVVEIAAGGIHGMALRKDGVLRVWGQISRVPVPVTNVVAIGATFDHCLALRKDGTVFEWDQYNDYSTPANLTNVVAISSGGAPHWVALRADGSVVTWSWTSTPGTNMPAGLSNATEIDAGSEDGLALVNYAGLRVLNQPQSVTALAGDSAVFTSQSVGTMPLIYNWTHDGSPPPGAVQPFLVLDDVQASSAGVYQLQVTNSTGSVLAHPVNLTVLDSVPRMQLAPSNQVVLPGGAVSVRATARGTEPMAFGWQKDGMDMVGKSGLGLDLTNVSWADTGAYRLVGTNSAGTAASAPAGVNVVQAAIWGSSTTSQADVPASATNLVAMACGDAHSVVLKGDGTVLAWGDDSWGQCDVPVSATNLASIAAGALFSVAVTTDGHCIAWGFNQYYGITTPPSTATNVIALAAGGMHCLALRQDGTVLGWGDNTYGLTNVPAAVTNVVAIACGANHCLVLRNDGSVLSWGQPGYGQTNVPPSATNVIAIAGGAGHSLALRADGSMLAWGDDSAGQCDVPAGLSNVVAIAAAGNFSMALSQDGTVTGWGDTTNNRTTTPLLVTNVDAIAAGSSLNGALVDDGAFHWTPATAISVAAGSPLVLRPRWFGRFPDSYQWLSNGVPIAGATKPWLVFADAQQFASADYELVMTSGATYFTGAVATVTVVPTAPVVTQSPASKVVSLGANASFSVMAQGTKPITYQWRFNGNNLPGATTTALTVSNVQWTNTGTYDVVLSNAVGLTVSSGATLTFQPTVDGFDMGLNNSVYALMPQPDGKVLLGGFFTTISGQLRTNLARLNVDGTLDNTFNAPAGGVPTSGIYALGLQPDGRILVGGRFTSLCGQSRIGLGRLNPDGTLDASFNPPLSANGTVLALALQPDGKILVGGSFSSILGQSRTNLARLNPDGTLDAGFVANAVGSVFSVAVQPDGNILVGGAFTALAGQGRSSLARLSTGGVLDTNFAPGISRTVYALLPQPDGHVWVGGFFAISGGNANLARLSPDGTLDAAFNPAVGGTVYALTAQADGKVIAAGSYTSLGGQTCNNLGRLNSDGTVDASFNPGANGSVYGVALAPDGRVIAGGNFGQFGGLQRSRLVRFSNAAPATQSLQYDGATLQWSLGGCSPAFWRATFDMSTNGVDWLSLGAASYAGGALWQMTNVPGLSNATLRARGFEAAASQNGSSWFDEASAGSPAISAQPLSQTNLFGTNVSFSVLAAGTAPFSYQWRKDGTNLVDGGPVFGVSAPTLTLFNVAGPDQGGYSVVISNAFGSITSAVASLGVVDPLIVTQPVSQGTNAGKNVVFRAVAAGTQPLSYQWRKDGVPLANATTTALTLTNVQWADTGVYDVVVTNAFGNATSAGASLGLPPLVDSFNPGVSGSGGVYALAVQPDQKVLVGGSFVYFGAPGHNSGSDVGRLNADGSVDTTFNASANGAVFALAVQPDGKILVGGWLTTLAGGFRNYLGRLNTDGTLDTSFNPAFLGAASFPGVYALALQPDGKILVGGGLGKVAGQSCTNLVRLNADGTPDAAFNASADEVVYSLALQPDGKILLGGNFGTVCGQPRARLARLNADGTLDTSFISGANDIPLAMVVQPDGKILAGGPFTVMGGQTCNHIGRLNPDGSLDLTFGSSASSIVRCLALQTDGRVLVGGEFSTLGNQPRNFIGRLNSDGSTDSIFNPGASSTVYGLAVQPDGKILAGGAFTFLAGQVRGYLGRMSNTYPAYQSLKLNGTTLAWLRSGASPELSSAEFSASTSGLDWVNLGPAFRVAGGWQATNVVLPANATVRARGLVTGGRYSASESYTETSFGAPAVSLPPLSRTNVYGTVAGFNVLAAGTPTLGYQWCRNGVVIPNGGSISGALTSSLVLNNVSGTNAGAYTVIITNAFGSITSLVATLTVLDPYLNSQPTGLTTNVAQTVKFTVGAIGTPLLNYQWRKNGAYLASATASILTLTNLHSYDAGSYDVLVSNSVGVLTSAVALLNINPPRILVNDGNLGMHSNLFGFDLSGVAGQGVLVEASTNLMNWLPIQTNLLPSGGVLLFTDPDSSGLPERFYRARYNDGP